MKYVQWAYWPTVRWTVGQLLIVSWLTSFFRKLFFTITLFSLFIKQTLRTLGVGICTIIIYQLLATMQNHAKTESIRSTICGKCMGEPPEIGSWECSKSSERNSLTRRQSYWYNLVNKIRKMVSFGLGKEIEKDVFFFVLSWAWNKEKILS